MRLPVACACVVLASCSAPQDHDHVVTVHGWVDASELAMTLPHEHVLVDFIGADSITPGRYNQDSAFNKILPFVLEYRNAGGKTIIECTPAYLGRDPALLKRLADASGVEFITNTGYYGAVGEKYLPSHAFTETADQLSQRWLSEWKEGIDRTGIQPGFMKLSADKGPLTPTQAKLIHAAALTHLETGLSIAVHNGDGAAAQQEVSILEEHGVSPDAFIWVHAQNEKDSTVHKSMAKRGAWIEFDGLNEDNVEQYVAYIRYARQEGFLDKVLISHDAGWYHVGETGGGKYRGYLTMTRLLLPMLAEMGFAETDIRMITGENPAKAFAVKVRRMN